MINTFTSEFTPVLPLEDVRFVHIPGSSYRTIRESPVPFDNDVKDPPIIMLVPSARIVFTAPFTPLSVPHGSLFHVLAAELYLAIPFALNSVVQIGFAAFPMYTSPPTAAIARRTE
jgi:hypothetical protein